MDFGETFFTISEKIVVSDNEYNLNFAVTCNDINNTILASVDYFLEEWYNITIPGKNDFASLDDILEELKKQVSTHIMNKYNFYNTNEEPMAKKPNINN